MKSIDQKHKYAFCYRWLLNPNPFAILMLYLAFAISVIPIAFLYYYMLDDFLIGLNLNNYEKFSEELVSSTVSLVVFFIFVPLLLGVLNFVIPIYVKHFMNTWSPEMPWLNLICFWLFLPVLFFFLTINFLIMKD